VSLTEEQINRYARHILLGEVGGTGQEKLLAARVLVVGAGGLGSPALYYLAAAGIGRLGIVDDDRVDLSNLQRQILHNTPRIGMAKVESAAQTLAALNPDCQLDRYECRIDARNISELLHDYDLVLDGSDNFATRYLLNDACYLAGKPLVSAAIFQFHGEISTYKAYLGDGHPCLRCLHPEPPPPGLVPSCASAGVLGALAGTMGSLQATEAVKELLGIGDSLSGRLLKYDALDSRFYPIRLRKNPACPLCGSDSPWKDLAHHG